MTNNKHTPGPWTGKGETINGADGALVVRMLFPVEQPYAETNANARLIASAPETKEQRDELLEACMWLVYLMHNIGKNGGRPSDTEYEKAGDFAKAAIDKATGKED